MNRRTEQELSVIYQEIVSSLGLTYRKQQLDFINNVYSSFFDKSVVAFHESPTGTGKSFGYLIPSIIFAQDNPDEHIIISSKTLTLQEQLLRIDIPKLQSFFSSKVSFAVMKGRANYLCGYRTFKESGRHFNSESKKHIEKWLDGEHFGEKTDFLNLGYNAKDWKKVLTEDSRECLKNKCPYWKHQYCCYYRAKKHASVSNIIIINHYLFFTDLWTRGLGTEDLIPVQYQNAIMDEGHLLEDIATQTFTYEFSDGAVNDLIYSLKHDYRISNENLEYALINASNDLIEYLNELEGDSVPDDEIVREFVGICGRCILQYATYLADIMNNNLFQEASTKIKATISRLKDIADILEMVTHRQKGYAVHKEKNKLLVTLINYHDILEANLFSKPLALNVVSATLSYQKKFLYPVKTLYIDELAVPPKLEGYVYPPVFNSKNKEFITPEKLADYRSELYEEQLINITKTLITKNNGSALLLFTSLKRMNRVYSALVEEDFPFKILMPSEDIPKIELLKEFKKDISSVLLGSYSFWEGIDVPGESLTLIIIDKLPFEIPSVVGDALNEQFGGFNYQCYKTSIKLKQGVGRLIRNENDRGFVVICDKRLYDTHWGKQIYASLND